MKNNNIELHQSVTDFLDYCRTIKGLSDESISGYYNDLKMFFDYIKQLKKKNITDRLIKNIELQDLHKFMTYLEKDCGNNARTRCRKVSTLKSYFEYLQNVTKLIISNPSYSLRKPKVPKTKPVAMSIQECEKLLNSLDKDSYFYYRDRCILMIFLQCGLRLSELINIKVSDVQNIRMIINGKGNKERDAFLSESCIKSIDDYLEVRNDEEVSEEDKEYLFLSREKNKISKRAVQSLVKKHMEDAGLDTNKYHTHSTRHTFATIAYDQGADIIKLSELLGHSNVNTSKIYITLKEEELREITNKNPLNKL
jgi:integrase/recombinase XerD